MKFQLFFVGFLTRRSLHRRNRRLRCRQGPYEDALFRLYFCRVPNRRQPTCSKKNVHHSETSSSETSSCVSRVIAKRSSWVEPGRERNGNVMWQSHITAVAVSHCSCFFPCSLFRAVEHHGVQPESLSYHSKLTWLLFPCCYYASSTMNNYNVFSIGASSIHLWVEWSRSENSKAEQSKTAPWAKRQSSARSANARATPGWTANVLYIRKLSPSLHADQCWTKIRGKVAILELTWLTIAYA